MGNQNVPNWSDYQTEIFENFINGDGDAVVLARAGTGKTTTATEAVIRYCKAHPSKRVLACAFNKHAADELKERFAKAGFAWKSGRPPQAMATTLHGLGLQTVKKAFGKAVAVDYGKGRRIAKLVVDEWRAAFADDDSVEISITASQVTRLADRAKEALIDPENQDAICSLAIKYGIADEFDEGPTLAQLAAKSMRMAMAEQLILDGSDMIWFPHVFNLFPYRQDLVVVDEAQDMNIAQLRLARKAVKKGGRLIAIGDDRQAIYGWRGADSEFLHRLVVESGAKQFMLPVTYRCGKSIVREAQALVPDYTAADGNAEGEVKNLASSKIVEAASGDFILSRTNAPLMKLCLSFLKEGRPAKIQGRDVMGQIIGLIDKSKKRKTDELLKWLDTHQAEQLQKLSAADADETVVETFLDKVETVRALAPERKTVDGLKSFIGQIFSDRDEHGITLSTAHRSKGLERDRVWLLSDTFRAEFGGEEANCLYVAITRAKSSLYYISGIK